MKCESYITKTFTTATFHVGNFNVFCIKIKSDMFFNIAADAFWNNALTLFSNKESWHL